MAEEPQSDLVKVFLNTAAVDGYKNLFAIGPFGNRVSFASQQKRALNTIWALEQANKIGPGAKVAVVGGGLAGVTAAVALASRQCVVHLYETAARVMTAQQNTNHRFLHPTINFWPEIPLEPTTEFPFFDWHADKCSEVIDALYKEWNKYFKQWVTKTHFKSVVTEIETTSEGLILHSKGGSAPEKSIAFQAVLLTVGFGTEKTVEGVDSKSYWVADEVANGEGTCDQKMVSGVGDGGVIDALRIVHKNFDTGRLCLKVIKTLEETGVPTLLRALEADVNSQYGGDPLKGAEDASRKYADGYHELLQSIPPATLEILEPSIRTDLAAPVLLIGRTSQPFSLNAAPIHKLMLAHAIEKGVISYKKGELSNGPILTLEGSPAAMPETCIVRHGPTCDMSGLINQDQIDSLRKKQSDLSDILKGAPYDGSHWVRWSNYPKQDFTDPVFVEFRYNSAADYILHEFNEPLFRANDNGKASYYLVQQANKPDLPFLVPKKLFGIKTEVKNQKIFHA